MNFKQKISLTVAIIIGEVAIIIASPVSTPQYPDSSVSLEEQLASPDSMMTLSTELFQETQGLKDSDPDSFRYYHKLQECYQSLMETLDNVTPGGQQWFACKDMLRQIDQDLEGGALFFNSQGDQETTKKFVRAFVDLRLHKAMEGESLYAPENLNPQFVYVAASDAYNQMEYTRSIDYFKLYFATGDKIYREQVYTFLGQAAYLTENFELINAVLPEGSKLFPENMHLYDLRIQSAIKGGNGELLQPILEAALEKQPNNPTYLNYMGLLCEDNNEYKKALDYFMQLECLEPNSLSVAKHIGLSYYNEAVTLFNQSHTIAKDEKEANRMRTQARNYFAGAAQKFEDVVASEPTAMKYLRCLGVSYLCMEKKDLAEGVNNKLRRLGEDPLSDMYMPPLANYEEDKKKNFVYANQISNTHTIPLYSEYATNFVTREFAKWYEKGWDETNHDYEKRVNAASVQRKKEELNKKAQEQYLKQYTPMLRLNEMVIRDYDADHEVYRIDTEFGSVFPKVSKKKGEHQFFRDNWGEMRFINTQFSIYNNQLQVAAMTFVSPMGNTYEYSDRDKLEYTPPQINVEYGDIVTSHDTNEDVIVSSNPTGELFYVKSDVDEKIPSNKTTDALVFALIIANNKYKYVSKVQYADHDGFRFREYCEKTLGIPKENIEFYLDITLGDMKRSINQLARKVDNSPIPPQVVVYYAGHGFPDHVTRDAYLMPVDSDPYDIKETGYSLKEFYKKLGGMQADNVTVFIDACFSGTQRDGDMILKERAAVIDTEDAEPEGNMFVLSACSSKETAQPYSEKNHGMFTYFLLKKIQESAGKATLKELSDYVISNVKATSASKKLQTPTVTLSGKMHDEWTKMKVKK